MEEQRKIYVPDGGFHYGLIRTPSEKTFATYYSLDLPVVDIDTLPESQGIATWLQIEDQGQQGSCQGNARTSATEVSTFRQTKKVVQYSRQFAYITSQIIDGLKGRDVGSTMEGGGRAAQKYGECMENLAPYTGRYYTDFSKAAYDDGAQRTLTTFVRMGNYDECLRWLVWGVGGLAIGIDWNNWMQPDSQGIIKDYRSGGGGGHALCIPDWTRKYADTMKRPYLDMFNSWGQWGYKGRAFLTPAIVDKFCKEQTVIGYSKMNLADIKPLEYDWLKQSPWL